METDPLVSAQIRKLDAETEKLRRDCRRRVELLEWIKVLVAMVAGVAGVATGILGFALGKAKEGDLKSQLGEQKTKTQQNEGQIATLKEDLDRSTEGVKAVEIRLQELAELAKEEAPVFQQKVQTLVKEAQQEIGRLKQIRVTKRIHNKRVVPIPEIPGLAVYVGEIKQEGGPVEVAILESRETWPDSDLTMGDVAARVRPFESRELRKGDSMRFHFGKSSYVVVASSIEHHRLGQDYAEIEIREQ